MLLACVVVCSAVFHDVFNIMGLCVVLLACVVVCSAVFHDVFNIVDLCVASLTGVVNKVIQPFLIAQKSWVMSAPQPGKVDSFLTGEDCLRRMDVGGSSVQLCVVYE